MIVEVAGDLQIVAGNNIETVGSGRYYASSDDHPTAEGKGRSLDDLSKSRWHDKERVLLAVVEAELARQHGGGGRGGNEFPPDDYDGPPHSDEDIPF